MIDILHQANEYNKKNGLKPISAEMQTSSAEKQKPIAKAFSLAASEHPDYKEKVFNAFKEQAPDLVKKSGAHDYDSLKDASYKQFGHEVEKHFNHLSPQIKFSWDKTGEHNYPNSDAMRTDLTQNHHLHVFQGGDDHPHTGSKTADKNGLSQNDKFRAVHDAFGHGILKNGFGPKGEETAWHIHSQMFTPLAKLAMTAETRGQNSWVNYSGANAGRHPKDTIFAPNKATLLPPEMHSDKYKGEIPHYLKDHLKEGKTLKQLKESLDSHYDYKYAGKTPNFDEHHYTFKSDKGEHYHVRMMHFGVPNKDKAMVDFDNKTNQGSSEFTKKEAGSAVKVFSTVHHIVKDHLDRHAGVKEIHFHGSPERAKAYDFMAKKISKSPKIDKQKFGTMYSFNRNTVK